MTCSTIIWSRVLKADLRLRPEPCHAKLHERKTNGVYSHSQRTKAAFAAKNLTAPRSHREFNQLKLRGGGG